MQQQLLHSETAGNEEKLVGDLQAFISGNS